MVISANCCNVETLLCEKNALRFYGDAGRWRQGKANRLAPSADETQRRAEEEIDWLFRNSVRNTPLRKVAFRLDKCSHQSRCVSGACPVCMRAAARAIVEYGEKFVERSDYDFVALTICPPAFCVPIAELGTFRIDGLKKELDRLLAKFGFTAAFGGIDFSFNEEYEHPQGDYCMVHAYIFVHKHEYRRNGKQLREYLKARRSLCIPRPLHAREFDGDNRTFAYCFKNEFDRRVGYRCWKTNRRNTKKRKMTVQQKIALTLLLDREHLSGRLYLFGNVPELSGLS